MSNKNVRKALSIFILLVTLGLFGYYAFTHPSQVIDPLLSLSLAVILLVVAAYFAVTFTNSAILRYSLNLLKHTYSRGDAFLLTAYSSIVNFFGPLQSGPGFRAVYLKKQHGIKLRDYTFTLLLYYGFFGATNALALGIIALLKLHPSSLWLWTVVAGVVIAGIAFVVNRHKNDRRVQALVRLALSRQSLGILVFTLLQCLCTLVIYYAELHVVDTSVGLDQILAYTAVANLTLFVALTPGAIGIRESFLLFSQRLHGIDSSTVIAASVIDRALYFVVLFALFLVSVGFHAKKKLGARNMNDVAT